MSIEGAPAPAYTMEYSREGARSQFRRAAPNVLLILKPKSRDFGFRPKNFFFKFSSDISNKRYLNEDFENLACTKIFQKFHAILSKFSLTNLKRGKKVCKRKTLR